MITYRDVEKKAMPPEKKAEADKDFFSFYIGRKITYIMTIPFLYSSISPNQITILSIIQLIIGFIICCFAKSKQVLLVGWFFFFLWSLLDGVDGNVARYKKQFSKLGDLYDTMGGYAAISLIYLASGIASTHTNGFFDFINTLDKNIYIIMGALASIFDLFPRLMMHKTISSFMNKELGDVVADKSHYNIIKIIILNISSISGGTMFFLCIDIIANILDLYTIAYFFLNMLKMIFSLYLLFKNVNER